MGQQLCPCQGQLDNLLILPPILISQNNFHQVKTNKNILQRIQKLIQKEDLRKFRQIVNNSKFYAQNNQNNYYLGSFNEGKANGFGIAFFSQILLYYGEFLSSVPYGSGTLKRLKKNEKAQQITQMYKGQFIDGVANGKGIYNNYLLKLSFDGKWQQIKKPYVHSIPINGILLFEDNPQISSVQFINYQQKDAIISYKNGNKYIGFVNELKLCPHGVGKMSYTCGDVYEGQWKNGKIHGTGTYEWKSGQKYQGQYIQGNKEGSGILYFDYDHKFTGMWKNGKRNGVGKCINNKGQIYKQGFWIQDVLDKQKSKQINHILQLQKMPIKDLVSQLGQNQEEKKENQIQIQKKLKQVKQQEQKYVNKLFNEEAKF